MAMVYRMMGDCQKAQTLINRVIKFNPQEPLYLTNIGLCFDLMHNFDSAIIYHKKAIEINPKWTASYANLIESQILKFGNTIQAHIVLDSLTKNSIGHDREAKILLDIYDGKYTEAYSEAKRCEPDYFEIKANRYLYLGSISKLLNNTYNAIRYYDSALVALNLDLAKDTLSPEIHGMIGMSYAGIGNKGKAMSMGVKSVEIAITNKNKLDEVDMIVNLAKIYTMVGEYDKAFKKIELLLGNPSNFSAGLLKLDPIWKPLSSHPEFKTLIAKYPN